MRKSNIKSALTHAKSTKRILSLKIRLVNNGRFSRVNGKVYDIKKSNDGQDYVIVENYCGKKRQDGRKWQSIRISNILSVKKDNKVYSKQKV